MYIFLNNLRTFINPTQLNNTRICCIKKFNYYSQNKLNYKKKVNKINLKHLPIDIHVLHKIITTQVK